MLGWFRKKVLGRSKKIISGAPKQTYPMPVSGAVDRFQLTRIAHENALFAYEAYDPVHNRTIELLAFLDGRTDPSSGEAAYVEFHRRFQAECEAASKIVHPGIARIYASGNWQGRLPGPYAPTIEERYFYYVRELVTGVSLRALLDAEGPPGMAEAMKIATGLLEVIQALHDTGHLHLAIWANNIFIGGDEQIKVMNMRIPSNWDGFEARYAGLSHAFADLPFYVSPEAIEGRALDRRADIYSCAAVIFEIFSGKPPFLAETVWKVALKALNEQPSAPSSINDKLSPAFDSVILKALSKDPEQRYASVDKFSAALNEALETLSAG